MCEASFGFINLMRKMVWGLKFFAVGIALFVDFCSSSPDSCMEERQRLKSQVRKLENRVMVQQQQIQELRNGNTISLHGQGDENIDLGDRTQYADCAEIYNDGNRRSGIYKIQPLKSPNEFQVYCDMTEGGGWTVIQRRTDGNENFERAWSDYKGGFGNIHGESWLGNDKLHYITSKKNYILKINLADFEGEQRSALYKEFKVGDEESSYQLSFGQYSGTAGDALSGSYHPEVQWWASHNGMKFSTYDRDNDRYEGNCAIEDKAGWWFNRCHSANLNGYYYKGPYTAKTDNGIIWYTWHGWWYSIKTVIMKIRPAEFEPNAV